MYISPLPPSKEKTLALEMATAVFAETKESSTFYMISEKQIRVSG